MMDAPQVIAIIAIEMYRTNSKWQRSRVIAIWEPWIFPAKSRRSEFVVFQSIILAALSICILILSQ